MVQTFMLQPDAFQMYKVQYIVRVLHTIDSVLLHGGIRYIMHFQSSK